MAINLLTENLLPLADVPAFLASRGVRSRFGDKPISRRTVEGWVQAGKLETTARGVLYRVHTSQEALARMLAGEQVFSASPPRRKERRFTDEDIRREHEDATRELKEMGVI